MLCLFVCLLVRCFLSARVFHFCTFFRVFFEIWQYWSVCAMQRMFQGDWLVICLDFVFVCVCSCCLIFAKHCNFPAATYSCNICFLQWFCFRLVLVLWGTCQTRVWYGSLLSMMQWETWVRKIGWLVAWMTWLIYLICRWCQSSPSPLSLKCLVQSCSDLTSRMWLVPVKRRNSKRNEKEQRLSGEKPQRLPLRD